MAPPRTGLLLEPDDALPRLLAWGLVDEAAVAAGGWEASPLASRNLHLRLRRPGEPGLLIKQPDPGVPDGRDTLCREGRFYAFCRAEPRASPVARLLVPLRRFLAAEAILVLELLPGARSPWEAYREGDATRIPRAPARALGAALGTVHATFRLPSLAADPRLGVLDDGPPGVLRLHRPHPGMLRHLGPADLRLLRLLQRDAGLAEGLDAARAAWRVETLIHGDVRSQNVLVAGSGTAGSGEVRLIDWEMAQRGDAAWDVAGVLADFASFWLAGMPSRPGLDAAARAAAAEVPLAVVQGAVRAFWRSYVAASGSTAAEASRLVRRAAAYAGARWIQSAWELAGDAEELSTLQVLLLQLAANVLADPERAARDLFAVAGDPVTA